MKPQDIAVLVGGASLALLVGALGFQYLGGIMPCEMCQWQRWPHIAAAIIGIGGGTLVATGVLNGKAAFFVAALALLCAALAGGLGVYHAGVEWRWWEGPPACTGPRFVFTGLRNLNSAHVVACDVVQWRLFGLSLAGYNALISFAIVAFGTQQLLRREA